MGIGVSVFLMAIGAILSWGVTFETRGVDLDAVGLVLMLVGAIGLGFSWLFLSSYSPFRDRPVVHDRGPDVVVHDRVYREPRHVEVIEDDVPSSRRVEIREDMPARRRVQIEEDPPARRRRIG